MLVMNSEMQDVCLSSFDAWVPSLSLRERRANVSSLWHVNSQQLCSFQEVTEMVSGKICCQELMAEHAKMLSGWHQLPGEEQDGTIRDHHVDVGLQQGQCQRCRPSHRKRHMVLCSLTWQCWQVHMTLCNATTIELSEVMVEYWLCELVSRSCRG